jgi:cytochrome oxidase Cu insertion factor (SCO1/SenC/PrrC family)
VVIAAPPAPLATPFVPVLAPGDAVPDTTLIDQRGRRVLIGGEHPGATIVSFFYTRCREANECALTSAKFAKLQELLRGDTARLVEISIDPARDTASVLARYGRIFSADPARWTLATGTPGAIEALERRLGNSVAPARDGQFAHDDEVVVIDGAGRIADTIAGDTWSPSDVAATTHAIEGRPSDIFARVHLTITRGIAAACGGAGGGISLPGGLAIFGAALAACGAVVRRIATRASP